MKNVSLVLKNNENQIVRTIRVSEGKLIVAKNLHTQRIEFFPNRSVMNESQDSFEVLAETTTTSLKSSPLRIGTGLSLTIESENMAFSPTYAITSEREGNVKEIFRWTAIVHLLVVGVALTISLFVDRPAKDEPRLVTVLPQNQIKKDMNRPTVSASKKKVRRHKKEVKKQPAKKKHYAKRDHAPKKKRSRRSAKRGKTKSQVAQNKKTNSSGQGGVLGVLGSFNSKAKGYGASARKARVKRSAKGSGDSAGLSGMGAGLTASSGGQSDKASNVRGSGTRGRAGGQKGYGEFTTVGNFNAVSTPVDSDATVEGGLDRSQIAAVIRRHQGQLRYCYEKGLQTKPELRGRVAVHFIISNVGRVDTAKVTHTSLRSQTVESCLMRRLRSWKFPQPIGNVNVKVTYPFVFKRLSQG